MQDQSSIDDLVSALGFRFGPNPQPSIAPSAVHALEKALGGRLPEDYLYFIGRYGGAILGGKGYEVQAPITERCPWGESTELEYFYQLTSTSSKKSLLRIWQSYQSRIPRGVLCFNSDGGGNEICVDVAGDYPGTIWFWDHEQRWFAENHSGSLEEAAREIARSGVNASQFSVHDIIRTWARLHAARWDRPPDYMGMYRIAASFKSFLSSLRRVRYDSLIREE